MVNPNPSGSLIKDAVQAIARLLPPDWSVQQIRSGARDSSLDDQRIQIRDRSGNGRVLLVDIRPTATPAELDKAYSESVTRRVLRDSGNPMLVVSPYLSPRSRQVLEGAEINYLDLTGNARIVLDKPGLSILTVGAQRDPQPRKRPDRGFSGAIAGKVIRALADFYPPYSVSRLAKLADVSVSYCSRTLQALEREALVHRDPRGSVKRADWAAVLRRRGNAVELFDRGMTKTFISREGVNQTLESLLAIDDSTYAVTGSFAASRIRQVTAPTGLAIYAPDPEALATLLNLLPADRGADVWLKRPTHNGYLARSEVADGIRWVAPSQVVLDCLGGTGRMPQEGEAVLDWMIENEPSWRSAP